MWQGSETLGPSERGRTSTGSEVVILEDQVLNQQAMASRGVPTVANLNVSHKSRVHLGPKFVTVTQNVHNSELIKGRFLGLELVSERARGLRCGVTVFVCWALVVAAALTLYLCQVLVPKQLTRLNIDLNAPWYLRREDWQAMPAYAVEFRALPVKYVIVGHSATDYCDEKYKCIQQVMAIQQDHLRRGLGDIGPNYLVSGNGLVFEGRGANVIGAMAVSWNTKSVTVMFLGNYVHDSPDPMQFENLNTLLRVLVNDGVLQHDYVVYGHCQVAKHIVSPGPKLMHQLHEVTHWSSDNQSKCLKQ